MNENGHELGWDDAVEDNSGKLIPEGEYNFKVQTFERGRFAGSEKMPPCAQAMLTLSVETQAGSMPIKCSLLLHTNIQWRLFQFFECIGLKPDPNTGKIKPDWSIVSGASGRCKITVGKYKNKNGVERDTNDIEFLKPAQAQRQWKPGAF